MHEKFPEFWSEFALATARNIKNSHEYITRKLAKEIPIYFMRYEDLISNPEIILTECFKFILETLSLDGTVLEKRIKKVVK